MCYACSSRPYVVNPPFNANTAEETVIYLLNHGWHTGLVVPAIDIQQLVPRLKERFNSASYIEFGWGDQDFYQADEITTGLTLKAVFWPTGSVVHAAAKRDSFYLYFPANDIISIKLDGKGYASLLQFISGSFHKDAHEEITELGPGIYGNSRFYKGTGRYYLFNTCNRWTAKALKSGGLDVIPIFNLTASRIMKSARKYSHNRNR
jgi:uncharacterized protein (TIGR02117 family)